jgi:hypothetical protein
MASARVRVPVVRRLTVSAGPGIVRQTRRQTLVVPITSATRIVAAIPIARRSRIATPMAIATRIAVTILTVTTARSVPLASSAPSDNINLTLYCGRFQEGRKRPQYLIKGAAREGVSHAAES